MVLRAHDNRELPIARATSIRATDGRLLSTAKFPEPGAYPFADTLQELVDAEILNPASVRFVPREPTEVNERSGLNMAAELLDWSIVPVPADAGTLM